MSTPAQTVIYQGAGLGTCLATAVSWSVNKGLLWAALHGFFGWGYVIYYALGYGHTA